MLKILVPMAGLGQRFADAGYKLPKPMIDIKGKPMIERVVESIRPKRHEYQFIFIVQQEHIDKYNIDATLKRIEPSCKIVVIDHKTEGSGVTLLSASHLFYGDEVIVSVCDAIQVLDMDDFIDKARDKDGLIATFETNMSHFCFVDMSNGQFVRVKEKEHISTHASTGIWHFKSGASFIQGIASQILNNDRINNEFYCTHAYNYLEHRNIDIYNCKAYIVGTPGELNENLPNI